MQRNTQRSLAKSPDHPQRQSPDVKILNFDTRNIQLQKYAKYLIESHVNKGFVERPAIVARNLEISFELLLFGRNHRLGQVYEWNC